MTLIQPASKWMHWATLRRHSKLLWAATSTSSQVIFILNKSLLTVFLQLVRGRPGPLFNPGTCQCNACRGLRWWSTCMICPSQRSLLSRSMSPILCCPVLTLTSSFVTLSFWKCPRCSFAICDEQRSVFSFVLLLEAIHLHCTEGLTGLLLYTTSFSPLGQYTCSSITFSFCTPRALRS